jgi:predicted O-linked N-acetylglucosamine transferase (SPINDLY family)
MNRLRSTFGAAGKAPAVSVDELKRQGIAYLDAGEPAKAVGLFRQAAELEPDVAAHQVNLAYALQQTGAHEDALPCLRRAATLAPDSFDAHYMLAGGLERVGDHAGAVTHLRHAVRLDPGFLQAHADLGRVLSAAGDKDAARAALTAGLALGDAYSPLHLYLGNVWMELGEAEKARQHYLRADALAPGSPEVQSNLGRALHVCKDFEGALRCFHAALDKVPDAAQVHFCRGITLKSMDRLDEAVSAFERAVELQPDHADAVSMIGTVRAQQGRLHEAMACYQRAIELRPDLPGAYGNLGLAMYELGQVGEAIVQYRKGLSIRSVAEIHDNLGIALLKQCAPDEAVVHFRKALELQPDNVNTRCNLAVAMADDGGYADGIRAFREVLAFKPDHLIAYCNLLHYLSVDPQTTPGAYLAEAARFNAKLTHAPLPAPPPAGPQKRPLRVGLVSGDLRVHPVGYFIEGILQHLDGAALELYGYPTGTVEDELTARIRPRFSGWRPIKGLGDEAAARAIRSDGIDILVDLAGHTGDNRLPVFAWRPAPLQVTWLGYWASTGVEAIDYILADALCAPPGHEHHFSEKVWRLPDTRMCFTAPAADVAPAVAALPALARGHLTFGCFQRMPKINDGVIALWARVLEAVPDARLLIQTDQGHRPLYADRLRQRLQAVGIDTGRIEIRGPAPRKSYLQSYADVDIVLDTFPFTGGTTTCEALWMGVPTLTVEGRTMIELQGRAMMTLAGLPDWVAKDGDDLVRKAAAWSQRLDDLAGLRASLRGRLPETPLFDAARFARSWTEALREMWHAHHTDRAPAEARE